jgi:hypothetical protein
MEVCLRPVLLVFAIALLLANLILIAFSTWGQDAVVPVSKARATGLRMQTNGSDANLDNAITLENGTNGTTGLTGSVEPQWQSLLHSVESHDCNFTATTITTTAKNEFISEDDFLYCNSHNMFLDRADGYAFTKSQGPEMLFEKWIPYTITPFTFQKFHDTTCSNITDLTQAMRYGTRSWIKPEVQNKTALEREVEQSYFMPKGCDIGPLSRQRICGILNQYSHVLLVGNSMIRHLRQAMLMAIRKDFVLGGQLSDSTSGRPNANPYRSCRCDGQFSEHSVCRQLNQLFWKMTPRQLHICSFLEDGDVPLFQLVTPEDPLSPLQAADSTFIWDDIKCEDPQYKGIFLLISPLLQWQFRKNLTLQNVDEYFLPYMNHPVIQNCSKAGKLKVVWMNYHAQSRQLDAKYPAQRRESTAAANQEMEQLLVERGYGHVPILDMMNLTTDAQTSDGYHFLSDVNLYKAYSVLAAADLLATK